MIQNIGDTVDFDSDDSLDELPLEEQWQQVQHQPEVPEAESAWNATPTPVKQQAPSPISEEPLYDVNAWQNGLQPSDISNLEKFFEHFGYSFIPMVPSGNRPLEVLLKLEEVWSLSRMERERLHRHWANETRQHLQESYINEFERLRDKYKEVLSTYQEGKAAVSTTSFLQ